MYPVPDDDLNLLESYLDDALSDEQIDALRSRLAIEPAMAAALRVLRDELQQRQAFFQSIEPTTHQIQSLTGAVHAGVQRKLTWAERIRTAKFGSALAACIVIGLFSGALFRSAPNAMNQPAPMRVEPAAENYPVELTDDAGHVIAVQHFDNADLATDFARDLRQMQRRQATVAAPARNAHGDF